MYYNKDTLKKQKEFFKSGKTKDIQFRIENLNKLKKNIEKNEQYIMEALKKDLGKSNFESYSTELGIVLIEISFIIKHLKKWAKPKKVKTPITNFKSSSYIYPEPYGNTLILSPWNYPFQLSIVPLIGSIAAGNTVILKPSSTSYYTSKIIEEIINENFDTGYIHVITGERGKKLLDENFDYIFYTGSVPVGKIVMKKASKYLTPVTLELGGKSPCIVDGKANLNLSAKRIVWGKFLNSGQTCVAPDYMFIHKNVKNEMINNIIYYIKTFYGENPLYSEEYTKIINERQFNRLIKLLDNNKIIYGGDYDKDSLYISPTLMNNVNWDDPIMGEEIFGPILPILEYEELNEVIDIVNSHPKPLALYFFSNDKENAEKIINGISFGGGCINDTIMHLSSPYLPFGGVGTSGMGSYHGKKSFDTFTHYKSILEKSNIIDPNFRYPPYGNKLNIVKKFLK
ncbi:aldehyde dehydrogenase [Anaerosalibacter bizertensis]|uniref:Aldehyde dehydrogenase n=1 Tax=Anaerosalibacter bizertensis TaxID=932217 RepID=A0A9Q4FK99_9FIRM|nr:aldehyde dehydrogenase [Anaerosalibacter bizertensis]MBV1817246.1 aldehyde dehydrogenase [Bacteroidales bacterium MSK.15.36]MCG4564351.1 aldehyde dehydrogenase [Anaerosalibacter bizertensis]MCG4583211.1 aldehyde dehydrogenase [Anaerosalibacter bizertensis]